MERTFAKYFHEQVSSSMLDNVTAAFDGNTFTIKVREIIGNDADREKLFESLRVYQSSHDLTRLLTDLHQLLNEPQKLELYEHIRPLILLKHQIEYSRKSPQMPGVKLRVIRLKRHPGDSIGFAVRGGFEHGVGVFVSRVESGSQAEKRGLKVGDEIVRVNGFTIAEAIHEDVLNLIKSREEIILKVTHIGMLPYKDQPTDNVAWKYVQMLDSTKVLQEVLEGPGKKVNKESEIKIFINTAGVPSIGCGIVSGPSHFPGIFVEKVRAQSLAEEVGLEVGDQIMEVNGSSFENITHKEAVVNLKGSKQLQMIIKKKTGLPLFEHGRSQPQRNVPPAKPAPGPNRTIITVPSEESEADTDKGDNCMTRDRESENDVIKQLDGHRMNISVDVEPIICPPLPPPSPPKPPAPTPSDDDLPPPPPPLCDATEEGITSFSVKKTQEAQVVDVNESVMSFDSDDVTSTRQEQWTSEIYKNQPDVLGGRGAILAARQTGKAGLTLLGAGDAQTDANMDNTDDPYLLFSAEQVEGKDLCIVELTLDGVNPMGLQVEGGIGTPLVEKILVADIYGVAHASGEIEKGDQVMMVNGRSLVGVTEAQARNILKAAEDGSESIVKMVIAKGGMLNDEDAITYF